MKDSLLKNRARKEANMKKKKEEKEAELKKKKKRRRKRPSVYVDFDVHATSCESGTARDHIHYTCIPQSRFLKDIGQRDQLSFTI